MKLQQSNKKIEAIVTSIEANGIQLPSLVEELTALRELALKEEDPLVTKTIRLVYECLEETENFQTFVFDESDEDEEGNEIPGEELNEVDSLVYFLNLLKKTENKYNRDEIQVVKHQLLDKPYERNNF
jgi:hypothetical protein